MIINFLDPENRMHILEGITRVNFSIQHTQLNSRSISAQNWQEIASFSGTNILKIKIYGLITGLESDLLVIKNALYGQPAQFEFIWDGELKIKSLCSFDNYERWLEPGKAQEYILSLSSNDKPIITETTGQAQ